MITKKLSTKQIDKHLNEINVKGYTCIKSFFSKKTIGTYLNLTNNIYRIYKISKHIPKVWNSAKIIYNLQNKDLKYLKIIQNNIFDRILKSKLNDPHFRNLDIAKSNYILNNFQARSSGNEKLFLHIDSGIPTGDVTTFLQIAILLEPSNKSSGCTIVVPKSHKSKKFANRKIKSYKFLEGSPGDVFIWDGNLWHGSLPNELGLNRWALIATFSNWRFKQIFDIPRTLSQKFYKKLTIKEKILLGYLGIPSNSEHDRVSSSIKVAHLKKNVKDFYK